MIHTVTKTDTLYNIARTYNTTVDQLVSINDISMPSNLVPGQTIIVPGVEGNTYTVRKNDSLYLIAKNFNISLNSLIRANPQIANPNSLQVGQTITIPNYKPKIEVNGFALETINPDILFKTLPDLTYLSLFSYEVAPDGSLKEINDENLLQMAVNQNVAPIISITNIGESGSFESELAHIILTDSQVQETFINNIIETVKTKGYYGVNVDFEYLFPEDKDNYVVFLHNLKTKLGPDIMLSVAVAPKNSDDQPGLLYEAHDYKAIGEIADRVIIMTYEWGFLRGEPQAIAPFNEVEKVISYATTRIPSEKILMGMPNYAYDWTLPFVEGTSATVLTNKQALELAINNKVSINFDEKAQAPYFNYVDEKNKTHVVWFEDARSIKARLNLVTKYDLAGVSYWTINNYFAQNWRILNSMFTVKKVI